MKVPWVEKYRPHKLCDVTGNKEAISHLTIFSQTGNIPNLIISGPPGTGKTTSLLCLARTLLGESFSAAVLELNASQERGIDVVRNKIKDFAQKRVNLAENLHKMIILDEADSITKAAQQALRRTIEIYSKTTRFFFACNDSTKIIEPIQSRCAIIRFTRLADAEIYDCVMVIAKTEAVSYDEDGLRALVFCSDGDMRNAINNLQSTVTGMGDVTSENVFAICDEPRPSLVKAILDACVEGKIDEAEGMMTQFVQMGYSGHDIISMLFRVCKSHKELEEGLQIAFMREIGLQQLRLSSIGLDSEIQLSGLLSKLCLAAGD